MSAVAATKEKSGKGFGIYVALAPWVAFTLLAAHSSMRLASIAALVISAGIAIPAITARKPKLLELGAVVTFAIFVAIAFTADATTAQWVAKYARGLAAAGLALIAFTSLLFVPFTEQYARESVPQQFWHSPKFVAANRQLTAMWGAIFLAMVPFHIIAAQINTTRGNLIFNWAIPLGLVLWGVKQSSAQKADAPAAA
jgi:hypothetical protein